MKTLVYGTGAIGSLMIHYLCKAGNDVTVVARKKYDSLRQNGLVIRHYFQRTTTTDYPEIVDKTPDGEEFDIVFSVMQSQQQKALLDVFATLNTKLIVLVGNNLEADYCLDYLKGKNVLFAFQNSAGRREDGKTIVGRMPVTELVIGGLHNAASDGNLQIIRQAFAVNGYKITAIDDMYAYYLCHVAEVMPYAYMCYKTNCNIKQLTRGDIKTIMKASNECFNYLKSIGVNVRPKNEDKFYSGGLKTAAMFLLYRLMSKTVLGRLMIQDHCENGIEEMLYIDQKFENLRQQNKGTPMPVWNEIRKYLKIK